MGKILDERRASSAQRLNDFCDRLTTAATFSNVACVYSTGSFARGEAGGHSDLDLFIVGVTDDQGTRRLKRLDEILIKADLIRATEAMGLPPFSGDGRYLEQHTVRSLCDKLGDPEDDAVNTFTARMLLLLESCALVGQNVYGTAITDVIAEYWRDFPGNSDRFLPAFLANDIVRMWKTLCVNYEARTESVPEAKRAERKLLNYKLKHSRMLTCYSALLYLCQVHARKKTVAPDDAVEMTKLTPTQRLERIKGEDPGTAPTIDKLFDCYERFLRETDASKDDLILRFLDKDRARQYADDAREFGGYMFELLGQVGRQSELYRYIVL